MKHGNGVVLMKLKVLILFALVILLVGCSTKQISEGSPLKESETKRIEKEPEIPKPIVQNFVEELRNNFELVDLNKLEEIFIKNKKFMGYFVVADNSPAEDVIAISDIAESMQFLESGEVIRIDSSKVLLSSEVKNTFGTNLILVGSPCLNFSVMQEVLGGVYHQELCDGYTYNGLPKDKGIAFMINKGGMYYLLVMGYKPRDTIVASKYISNKTLEGDMIFANLSQEDALKNFKGSVKDTLLEGSTKIYTIQSWDYEVTLEEISDKTAKFVINNAKINISEDSVDVKIDNFMMLRLNSIDSSGATFTLYGKAALEDQAKNE